MTRADASAGLYALNLTLLTTHQVDAAFWREWEVFGVPGGLPFFLVFNLLAVGLLAFGLVQVARAGPRARLFSLLEAGTGAITLALHAFFLFQDRTAFWAPASLALFAAIALTSAAQLLGALGPASARRSTGRGPLGAQQ